MSEERSAARDRPSPWAIAERRPPSGWVITEASLQRFALTIVLCLIAALLSLWGTFMGGSLVVVPLFSLQNEMWNRPDNPATWPTAGLGLLAGLVCLHAARSDDRTRRRLAVAAVALGFVWQAVEFLKM